MNVKSRRLIALLLVNVLLSTCTVMSEEECRYADWEAVGYEDGSAGLGIDRFGNYRSDCAEFGITPDFGAWQSGREAGLVNYCQPRQGFNLGRSGRSYDGVCAGELEPGFLEGYRLGSELNELRRIVSSIESELNSRQEEIDELDAEIDEFEAILIVAETSPEERADLLATMRDMTELRSELIVDFEFALEQHSSAQI